MTTPAAVTLRSCVCVEFGDSENGRSNGFFVIRCGWLSDSSWEFEFEADEDVTAADTNDGDWKIIGDIAFISTEDDAICSGTDADDDLEFKWTRGNEFDDDDPDDDVICAEWKRDSDLPIPA